MPRWRAPDGGIRRPSEGEGESPLPGDLWSVASNSPRWVDTDTVSTTPTESSSLQLSTTLHTA